MSRILRRPMFRGGSVDSYGTGIASGLGTRSQYRTGGVSYNPYNKAQTSNLLGRNTSKGLPDLSQFGESKISSIFNPVQITPQGFQKSSPLPGSDQYAMLMKNLYPGSAYGEPISEEDIEESLEQGGIFDNYGTASSIRRGEGEKLEPSSRIKEGLFGSGVFDESDFFREREATRIPFDNVQELRDEPASTSPELEAIRQQNIADLENIDKIDNSPKEVKTPKINETDETDETEVTMTDLEKALGLDKARRRDLGDMLGRASAAFLGTGDVREGLSEFMAAEAKAGPSRTERIKSIAGLEEYKSKKAKEIAEIKLRNKTYAPGNAQKNYEFYLSQGIDKKQALNLAMGKSRNFDEAYLTLSKNSTVTAKNFDTLARQEGIDPLPNVDIETLEVGETFYLPGQKSLVKIVIKEGKKDLLQTPY